MSILRRLWPRRRAADRITMGVHVVAVPKPIPAADRMPDPDDLEDGCCWWGHWQGERWVWVRESDPLQSETHWLPATVEVLPARCCSPEVKS